MTMAEADIREIQQIISPILGQDTWGAQVGIGSFVTAEFGSVRPPKRPKARPHGDWNLWVYRCAWRLETPDIVLAASEDTRDVMETAINQINGRTILSIDLFLPAPDAVFAFEGGFTLRLFPNHSSGDAKHWMLFTPEDKVLTIGPGSTWSYDRSGT